MQLNDKKISKTQIFPGLKINAVACENILKDPVKSWIDMNCFVDENISVSKDGSTDNAVKNTNVLLKANLPRLLSGTERPPSLRT